MAVLLGNFLDLNSTSLQVHDHLDQLKTRKKKRTVKLDIVDAAATTGS